MNGNIFIICMAVTALISGPVSAQDYSKSIFDGHSDVGACKLKGDLIFNPPDQGYTISGSGDNIWFGDDQFHFAWKKVKGDFILSASVQFIGEGSHLHRKAGWMIRQSLDPGSEHISATVHGDGLTSLQYRLSAGADMAERKSGIVSPDIIQLERKGNRFILSWL